MSSKDKNERLSLALKRNLKKRKYFRSKSKQKNNGKRNENKRNKLRTLIRKRGKESVM